MTQYQPFASLAASLSRLGDEMLRHPAARGRRRGPGGRPVTDTRLTRYLDWAAIALAVGALLVTSAAMAVGWNPWMSVAFAGWTIALGSLIRLRLIAGGDR